MVYGIIPIPSCKDTNKREENQILFEFSRAKVSSSFSSEIVQIERNTKGKLVFLCISEMQPIFEPLGSEIVQNFVTTKHFPKFITPCPLGFDLGMTNNKNQRAPHGAR